jgi:hypothetical protein
VDGTALLIQIVLTLVFAAVLVGWFTRSASDPKEVVAWARGYDLELTPGNHAMVTYYVRLAITLRVIGGVGGLILGALFDDATGLDTSSSAGFWIWIVLGWLLGASWAEYRLTRPLSTEPAASLTPRQVQDYLSARLYAAPAVAAAMVVLLAAFGLLAPTPVDPAHPLPPTVGLVIGAVGAVVIAGLITLAVRAVVARRQPTSPPDVVAADDAIRSSAVHNLAGGGTAAILLIASQVSFSVLAPRFDGVGGLTFWVSLAFALGAFVAWRWSAYRHWRVRRAAPTAAVPS